MSRFGGGWAWPAGTSSWTCIRGHAMASKPWPAWTLPRYPYERNRRVLRNVLVAAWLPTLREACGLVARGVRKSAFERAHVPRRRMRGWRDAQLDRARERRQVRWRRHLGG